jgi:hypothetical protein
VTSSCGSYLAVSTATRTRCSKRAGSRCLAKAWGVARESVTKNAGERDQTTQLRARQRSCAERRRTRAPARARAVTSSS